MAYLKTDKALTKVPSKYIDFVNVFSPKLVSKLSKYIGINNYTIKLGDDWQLLYNPIYNIDIVKWKMLKAYIINYLANKFIKPSKSLAKLLIFIDWKQNENLRIYIDYWDFNNFIIKNWYFLFVVEESLNWLGWVQWFT